jgi:hypothetical protein
MDLLNHWKLDELRIAIIRDLADFIPENYYESLPNNDLMQRGGMDWELYKLIKDGQEKTPKKFSPRQVAACDVFKWIAIYVFTNAGIHKISKLPPQDAWIPERQAEYEAIKFNLNKMYELISSSSDSLLKDLNNWLLYLPENDAKPFQRCSFEWSEDDAREQVFKFREKFGFLPERIRETSLIIDNIPQIQKSRQLKTVSAASYSTDSQTEKVDYLNARQNKRDEQEAKERHELGRYTLNEAADFIGNNAEINKKLFLEDLKESAGTGELKVYPPHGLQRYQPKPKEGAVYIPGLSNPIKNYVPWYVEAFWDDLNNWLEKKESRIAYRFPDPKDLIALKNESIKGVTKKQVMSAFHGMHFDSTQWRKNLSSPPKWLIDCRVSRGVRGNNKDSAIWNPIKIAIALHTVHDISIEKLDTAFRKLKDWTDDWKDETELYRDS